MSNISVVIVVSRWRLGIGAGTLKYMLTVNGLHNKGKQFILDGMIRIGFCGMSHEILKSVRALHGNLVRRSKALRFL